MTRHWLEEALLACDLEESSTFPRDLGAEVVLRLPISLELLAGLSTHRIRRWLETRRIEHDVTPSDRRLHGCLVAHAGHGIVFLDANDDEAERRFTLAHEVSHFVLDHLVPRQRALKALGMSILPVLDGQRRPTREEALSAVLDRVQLGVQVHLMGRGARGGICEWDVEEAEQNADRFALELMAPARAASAELRRAMDLGDDGIGDRADEAAAILVDRFGLPSGVARAYVGLLAKRSRPRPTLTEELFGKR